MENKTLVIYHANCPDGFASAWAAWTVLGETADYLPYNYGLLVPDVTQYESIYIVDFSFPREVLLMIREKGKKVTVIDHHKTAEEALKDLDGCVFDMEHSGAVLTWNHFHPDEKPPALLLYVEDRDLWKWKLPQSREVSAAMRLQPHTFEALSEMAKEGAIINIISQGEIVLKFQQQIVDGLASKPMMRNIGGHIVPSVNTSVFFSEVTEQLCILYPNAPFSACWFERQDGKRQWRLTSRNGFDVSVIAKQYGGGGHAAASGFETVGEIDFYHPVKTGVKK